MRGLGLVLLGGAAATAVWRLLPTALHRRVPPLVEDLLTGMPSAVLGALLIPGLTGVLPGGHVLTVLLALLVAGVIAWRVRGVIGPVVAAVLVVFLGLLFGWP